MPVLDGDFEAFVTNLGKYNEGMLVGEWVKLPTTEEEMQKVFERIGIGTNAPLTTKKKNKTKTKALISSTTLPL